MAGQQQLQARTWGENFRRRNWEAWQGYSPFSGVRRTVGWRKYFSIAKLDSKPIDAERQPATGARIEAFEALPASMAIWFMRDWKHSDPARLTAVLNLMHPDKAAPLLAEWEHLTMAHGRHMGYSEDVLASLNEGTRMAVLANHAGLASRYLETCPIGDAISFLANASGAHYPVSPDYGSHSESLTVAMRRSGAMDTLLRTLTTRLRDAKSESLNVDLRNEQPAEFLRWAAGNLDDDTSRKVVLSLGAANLPILVGIAGEKEETRLKAPAYERVVGLAKTPEGQAAGLGKREHDLAVPLARVVNMAAEAGHLGESVFLADELARMADALRGNGYIAEFSAAIGTLSEGAVREEVRGRMKLLGITSEEVLWQWKNARHAEVRDAALRSLVGECFDISTMAIRPAAVPGAIARARANAKKLGIEGADFDRGASGIPALGRLAEMLGMPDGAKFLEELKREPAGPANSIAKHNAVSDYEWCDATSRMEIVSNFEERDRAYKVLAQFGPIAMPAVLAMLRAACAGSKDEKAERGNRFARGRCIRLLEGMKEHAGDRLQEIDEAISAARLNPGDADMAPAKGTFEDTVRKRVCVSTAFS